jgi:hypothetical protein
MRIKLNQWIAGNGKAYSAGQEVDWPNEIEAQRFVDRGYAVRIGVADRSDVVSGAIRVGRPAAAVGKRGRWKGPRPRCAACNGAIGTSAATCRHCGVAVEGGAQ